MRGDLKPMKYEVVVNTDVLSESTDPDRLLRYVDIGNVDSSGNILGVEEIPFGRAPSRARRLPRQGDTIVSTVRTYLRAIAYVAQDASDLVCSTGFAVARGRTPNLVSKYLYYWLRSDPVVDEVCARSVGVSYPAFNASELGSLPIPLLPVAQQHRIAAFLDRKTAAIDALVAKKEGLVALLAEKRQALITQAVTKGLDPTVPMKDSGLEWLSPIPATWKVAKIGQLARVRNGSTPSRAEFDYWDDGTIPWLSSGKVNDYVVTEADQFITEKALRECSVELMPAGAVIVGMVGEGKTRGTSAMMKIPSCINQNMAAIVAGPRLRPWFLLHVLTAAYLPLREFGRGGQQDALNCQILSALRIPLPPVEQQDAIIGWIDAQIAKADRARTVLVRSIDKLREYRQALITAAVTGKLDVSGEAAA